MSRKSLRPQRPGIRWFAAAVAVVSAAGCLPAVATSSQASVPEASVNQGPASCKTNLGPQLARLKVPGLVAAIVKHGDLVCTRTAGYADIAARRPVTPDTLFLLASVSKTFTATAAMQLMDDGLVGRPGETLDQRLDTPIDRYLPFPVVNPNKRCAGQRITFRQLLTHTSSIKDYPGMDLPGQIFPGDNETQVNPAKLGEVLKSYLVKGGSNYYDKDGRPQDWADYCPGDRQDYSNMGITLLSLIVQEISHHSFVSFTKSRIFDPLGMRETSWNLKELPDRTHIATPYQTVGTKNAPVFKPLPQYGEWDFGDGMARTSARQLARFLTMFIDHGQYEGQHILRPATADAMRRLQGGNADDNQALVYYYDTFGKNSTNVLGHNGDDNGASADMFFDPATGSGVILLSNGFWYDKDGNDTPESKAIMDTLFKEAKTAW